MKVQCFGGRGSKRIRASKGVPIPDEAGEVGKQEPDHIKILSSIGDLVMKAIVIHERVKVKSVHIIQVF